MLLEKLLVFFADLDLGVSITDRVCECSSMVIWLNDFGWITFFFVLLFSFDRLVIVSIVLPEPYAWQVLVHVFDFLERF